MDRQGADGIIAVGVGGAGSIYGTRQINDRDAYAGKPGAVEGRAARYRGGCASKRGRGKPQNDEQPHE